MRIERIEKSKHKQERVLVFLEGGDLLRITGAELLRFGLYKGMDLSPALVVELQAAAQQSQLKQTAARMETLGAVDDEGYAGVIVRHYGAMGYGPGRVKQELHRRGVPRELWDEALAQLPPAADAVRKVVAARLRGRPMTQEDSRKLAAALQRRGFSWNDIRPVLNEWGQEIDET